MQIPTGALWRIEYHTDVTRADATVIPIGFMLEAGWESHARWLGLLFRQRLTAIELDLVNLQTWPELGDLDGYMNEMFTRAWKIGENLGSSQLARSYPAYSALHFAPQNFEIELGEFHRTESFQNLYGTLLGYEAKLQPVAVAPVLPLKRKDAHPFVCPPEQVELLNKAA